MESPNPQPAQNELADDILRGADEIAEFIFGKRGGLAQSLLSCRVQPLAGLQARRGTLRTKERLAAVDFGAGKPGQSTLTLALAAIVRR
jgi:hypothetical protein